MDGISALSVICLIGAVQGVLVVVALPRVPEGHVLANRLLSVFVGLVVLALLGRFVYFEGDVLLAHVPQIALLMDLPLYAYGPLLYLYLRSRLQPGTDRLHEGWWLHFIPVMLHFLQQFEYWLEPSAVFAERIRTGDFPFASIVVLGAVLQMGTYLAACCYLVYVRRPGDDHLGPDHAVHGYVRTILIIVLLGWTAWGYYGLSLFMPGVPTVQYAVVEVAWTILTLLPIALAYFAIGRQTVFKKSVMRRKYQGSSVREPDLDRLQQQLTELMATKKPYLEPELALADLAGMVGCSQKVLSRVINERCDANFSDYVNGHRVEEFTRLARDERYRNLTVLALAYEAGFNSKTTFYAAFKKVMPVTPAQYVKSQPAAAK